jgi:beta-glucosidase
MKKLALLILTLVLSMTLVACTEPSDNPDVPDQPLNCIPGYVEENGRCVEEEEEPLYGDYFYCKEEDDDCMAVIEAYISDLTVEEKAGQMIQAERGNISVQQLQEYGIGSILSGGGSHPNGYESSISDWYTMYYNYQEAASASSSGIPIIYGIDAVHGNNNLYGATIFPHNIGLGAANDPDLMYEIGQATAEEMLVTGINWNFAPALSVVQDIRWGRTYEGFSENPAIHLNLTQSIILGMEENGVSATAKHFVADGGTLGGIDQGDVIASEAEIREIHLAPYYEAIEADVDTIMISYSSISGIKMHGSDYWINDVLKDEMGFRGFIISDWNAIHQLPGDFYNQVVVSVNAGVDMLMEPYDWINAYNNIVSAVDNGDISMNRINDAVRRILTVKYYRGILDDPYYQLDSSYLYSQEHQDIAREAVRKSLVLLENNNGSLPLNKEDKIYVGGPGANHIGLQSGGWTSYWQGNTAADFGVGIGIKDAITEVLALNTGSVVNTWQEADTVIVVLAENPYSEGVGDNGVLTLTGGNAHADNAAALQLAQVAQDAGKNVVGILLSGRPLLLEDNMQHFDSFVAAWLPGSEGGHGISDVLFGDYNFTGKLSFTWPAIISQASVTVNDEDYDEDEVAYPYGYGLTY